MLLPIGLENFQELIQKKINFVDKTLLIKEVLDDIANKVIVITRPRRFGKTLNLSMLRYFLAESVHGKLTKGLFDGLKISALGDEYMQHQGQYPVIFISFKDIKETNFEDAFDKFKELMAKTFRQHREILDSPNLTATDKNRFQAYEDGNVTNIQLAEGLVVLCEYLYKTYDNKKVMLLIDEYDTPIVSAYSAGFYDEMMNFMRGLLGATLKTNDFLEKAVVTGILRVAKESLFSGVNNLEVYSLFRNEYSQHFGFTEEEIDTLLIEAELTQQAAEIKAWYNGYQIGDTVIYNPWSIANCIKQKGELKPYWVNTSDNQLIKDLLKKSPLSFKKEFEQLLKGEPIQEFIDENMVFQYLNNNPASVWSLLLMSGYLKPISKEYTDQGLTADLIIPNKEVKNLYRQIIEQWLANGQGLKWYNEFIESLVTGQIDAFKKHLETVILQITSYHDFAKEPEAFFQGLLLGFTATLHNAGKYQIQSNRESGLGRFDVILIPNDKMKPGVILELKACDKDDDLEAMAKAALQQIQQKQYAAELKQRGIHHAIQVGIGFCGKNFAVSSL